MCPPLAPFSQEATYCPTNGSSASERGLVAELVVGRRPGDARGVTALISDRRGGREDAVVDGRRRRPRRARRPGGRGRTTGHFLFAAHGRVRVDEREALLRPLLV